MLDECYLTVKKQCNALQKAYRAGWGLNATEAVQQHAGVFGCKAFVQAKVLPRPGGAKITLKKEKDL